MSRLYNFGLYVHDNRKAVVVFAVASLLFSVGLLSQGEEFIDGNAPPPTTDSGKALNLIDEQLTVSASNTVTYILSHQEMTWQDEEFQTAVESFVIEIRELNLEIVSISTIYDDPTNQQVIATHSSIDGKKTAVYVSLAGSEADLTDQIPSLKKLDSETLDVTVTGSLIIGNDFDTAMKNDTIRAEVVGLPLSLIILLFVFGTFTAAVLPLLIALLMIALATGISYWMSDWWFFGLTEYSVSMISLIGIAVSIDYSLFMISRFREEIAKGESTESAIATMMDTAGRAVMYSGATVAVGLCSLFYFDATHMPSMGMGAFLAVAAAMLYSFTVLPALLSYLGPRINSLPVPIPGANRKTEFWKKLSIKVMNKPLRWLIPALVVLLLAASPFLRVEMSAGGIEALPPDMESRIGFEILEDEFPAYTASSIPIVIVFTEDDDPMSIEYSERISPYCQNIAEIEGVIGVNHPICNTELFELEFSQWPIEAQEEWLASVSDNILRISVPVQYRSGSDESERVVREMFEISEDEDFEALIGGWSAFEVELKDHLVERIPAVLAFVLGLTIILVFLQVRSILVPVKAIMMNILSVSASFGIIVLVFQDGLLTGFLNYSAQPIDLTVPPLVFGIAFGLSMDYEVLMLSRIHEAWEETGDNTQAVAEGLQASGSLITGAAAIMVAVFFGFVLADVLIIKSIGFALMVAVIVDATIVRAIVVPSTMRLLGKANWWAPSWMR